MSSAAWSALADCFAAVAADGPIEFSTFTFDPTPFAGAPLRTQLLLRFRSMPTAEEELYSLRAEGQDIAAVERVNRFRWLCWAAGVLLDPHDTANPRESAWLRKVTDGRSKLAENVVKLAERLARKFTTTAPTIRPAPPLPVDDWTSRTAAFALLRDRFASPLFHGSGLRLSVGEGQLSNNSGGTIGGNSRAVEEFLALSELAFRLLPDELTTAFGPPLFPPSTFNAQVGHGPACWRWAVVMWLLLPAAFDLTPASETTAPILTLNTTPELAAAAVCGRLATSDPCELVADIRRRLVACNPWLDAADREAVLQAVAAVHPATVTPTAGEGQPATAPPPGGYKLTERQEGLLLTMLEMGAVRPTAMQTQAKVVRAWNRKANAATCKRDFGALKRHTLTDSAKGPKGGVWLTARGKAESERLHIESN